MKHTVTWASSDDVTDPNSPAADALAMNGRGRQTANGEFVRSLTVGDVVTVWAKARYPGWNNFVKSVGVSVYWAI